MLYANDPLGYSPIIVRRYSPVLKIKENEDVYNCYVGITNKNVLYFFIDKRMYGSDLNEANLKIDGVDRMEDRNNPDQCHQFKDMSRFRIKSIEQLSNNKIAILYIKDTLNDLQERVNNVFDRYNAIYSDEVTDIVLFERTHSGKIISYYQTEQGTSVWFSEKPEKEFEKTDHEEFNMLTPLFGAE
jgi:hypothetical protein